MSKSIPLSWQALVKKYVSGGNTLTEAYLLANREYFTLYDEDEQQLFDPTYSGWDMKITLEDLRKANTSLYDFLKKIHDRVNSDEVVKRVRERRGQMIKLVSDLISELEQYVSTLVNEVCIR